MNDIQLYQFEPEGTLEEKMIKNGRDINAQE